MLPNAPLHIIINHGSVVYLFLRQILFYDRQYVYDDNNNMLLQLGGFYLTVLQLLWYCIAIIATTAAIIAITVGDNNDECALSTVSDDNTSTVITKLLSNDAIDAIIFIRPGQLKLFYGRNDSSYYHTGTVLRPVYQQTIVATIFINLLRSHIIDHGSVLYLTLQILLYNQQYVFSFENNNVTTDMTYNTAVPVITKISSANYNEDSSAGNNNRMGRYRDSSITIIIII